MSSDNPYHDNREQVEKIEHALLTKRQTWAVYDMKVGGTGFIDETKKRVIVFDEVFMREMRSIVSIPFSRFPSVATEDDRKPVMKRGFLSSSKVILTTGQGQLELESRGADEAHRAHSLIPREMIQRAVPA